MLSLEPAINSVLNTADQEEDSVHLLDNILYTLAQLLRPALLAEDNAGTLTFTTPEQNALLAICQNIVKRVPVSTESAASIGDLSYQLLAAINRTKVEDMADKDQVDATKTACEKILKKVHELYPEEYQEICAADTQDVDMFFLGGQSLDKRPDEHLVAAKKALINNPLLGYFSQQLVNFKPAAATDKAVGKMLKKNKKDVETVLGMETAFLLEQLGPAALEKLLINLVVSLDKAVVPTVVRHICHNDFLAEVPNKLRLELVLIALFLEVENIQNHYFEESL